MSAQNFNIYCDNSIKLFDRHIRFYFKTSFIILEHQLMASSSKNIESLSSSDMVWLILDHFM